MEKFELMLKGIFTTIGGLISYILGGVATAPFLLTTFMMADFVTGLLASKYTGKPIKSDIGFRGLMKKAYVLILVWCIYRLEGIGIEAFGLDMTGFTGDAVAIMFLVMELVSIIENGDKMGMRFPKPIRQLLHVANKYLTGERNHDD